MTSAVSGRLPRARSFGSQVLRDLGGVAVLALVALGVGLVMNRVSSQPLPIVYQTPEQRFDAELTTLVAAPPFKIAPAAPFRKARRESRNGRFGWWTQTA